MLHRDNEDFSAGSGAVVPEHKGHMLLSEGLDRPASRMELVSWESVRVSEEDCQWSFHRRSQTSNVSSLATDSPRSRSRLDL